MPSTPATRALVALMPSEKSKKPPMKLKTKSSTSPESIFSSSLKRSFIGSRIIFSSRYNSSTQTTMVMMVPMGGMLCPPYHKKYDLRFLTA